MLDNAYTNYIQDPTPDNLNLVVTELNPTITYSLSNFNALNDPIIKSKAKLVVANSIKNFDPQYGASLTTHVSNQLKQLNRTVRKQRSTLQIPERQQLDLYALDRIEKEYIDKHGKDPDLTVLSDASGLSIKRIAAIRNNSYAVGTDSIANADDIGGGSETPDYSKDALDYIYMDSDYKDRKIMEHKLGYGGKPILSSQDIADKLKINNSQISRRSAKILLKVNELVEALDTQ